MTLRPVGVGSGMVCTGGIATASLYTNTGTQRAGQVANALGQEGAQTTMAADAFKGMAPASDAAMRSVARSFAAKEPINTGLNSMQRSARTGSAALPFNRHDLYDVVQYCVEASPHAETLPPALQRRLASELTDDVYDALLSAVGYGTRIEQYYRAAMGEFTQGTLNIIERRLVEKLSGKVQADEMSLSTPVSRSVRRRIRDQLRSFFPELFAKKSSKRNVRTMLHWVLSDVASNPHTKLLHAGRLTAEGRNYFRWLTGIRG